MLTSASASLNLDDGAVRKAVFDLLSPPLLLVTRDAIYERPLTEPELAYCMGSVEEVVKRPCALLTRLFSHQLGYSAVQGTEPLRNSSQGHTRTSTVRIASDNASRKQRI